MPRSLRRERAGPGSRSPKLICGANVIAKAEKLGVHVVDQLAIWALLAATGAV